MLEEFIDGGSQVPRYAILSHTWAEEEVTFQDFTHLKEELRHQKLGFRKIEQTCQLARQDGLQYAWVDTCCIDKTSSAEVTEAINSMFKWYTDAAVCYAWLADLPAGSRLSLEDASSSFKNCRWFTRGWTLQELIAPKELRFYDQEWSMRGTKADLRDVISHITKIDADVLHNSELLYSLSMARRMSWATTRQTTRIEDLSYCLLGIFDVNMPMLYGEGERAFSRLQEEIIKESNDLSIFAWRAMTTGQRHRGILAYNPSEFRDFASVTLINDTDFSPDFLITNKGLRITTDVYPGQNADDDLGLSTGDLYLKTGIYPRPGMSPNYDLDGTYLMSLNCSQPDATGGNQQIGIRLKMHGGSVYSRVRSNEFGAIKPSEIAKTTESTRSLFIKKRISSTLSIAMSRSHKNAFMFRKGFNEMNVKLHDPSSPFEATTIRPKEDWDSQRRMFLTHGDSNFTACVHLTTRTSNRNAVNGEFVVAFGKTSDTAEPWIALDDHGGELYRQSRDLKKLRVLGISSTRRRVVLPGPQGVAPIHVYVSMEKAVVGGQEVYCIDLSYNSPQRAPLRPRALSR